VSSQSCLDGFIGGEVGGRREVGPSGVGFSMNSDPRDKASPRRSTQLGFQHRMEVNGVRFMLGGPGNEAMLFLEGEKSGAIHHDGKTALQASGIQHLVAE